MSKMMMVTAMVPVTKVHEIEEVLKNSSASQVMWRPVLNGHAEPAPKTKNGRAMNRAARSAEQQEWIAKHAKGDFVISDLREAWGKTGFREKGLYGALKQAVKLKMLKKLIATDYRRIA